MGLQESCRLPKRERTRMTICTYHTRTLASEAAIENLMMQARKINYDVMTDPLKAVCETGEELRGVGGVSVLVNTTMAKNIDFFEQLNTRIGRLGMRRCYSMPVLTIFVAYSPTSSYEEEVEAFYGPDGPGRSSTEKTIPSITPKLAPEKRLKNFTSEPMAFNGMSRKRSFPRLP
ncbi:hypothetical protein NECAME_10518 [Necator americanus]|uniref:Uncharacterized protein n=1 Tax=Necator americanus TaxID=51031 RepID=W2TAH5_NECAM|nr:hypothetical protein NECAME_10518 [Necator americanus]ETN78196.1 hypothetical protein NECAME_10518 [Necator americanus]